jgi:MFS family permease
MMAPMMGGVIVASVTGGRLVARTGHYKMFPIVGLAAATGSFLTIAWAALTSAPTGVIETALIILGAGLGLVMPNLTVAIQNSVERKNLGIATSVSAFIRSLGSALGVAISGAVVALRLRHLLPPYWTQPDAAGNTKLEMGIQQLRKISAAQGDLVVHAYRHAIATTFLTGAAIAAGAFCLVLFLPELPLRSAQTDPAPEPEKTNEPVAY